MIVVYEPPRVLGFFGVWEDFVSVESIVLCHSSYYSMFPFLSFFLSSTLFSVFIHCL